MADSPLRRAHQEWIGNVRPEGLLVSLPALELAQAAVDRNERHRPCRPKPELYL